MEFLKEFLSRVLNKKIVSIEYLRNELDINYPEERKKVVDFVALIDGEYIHIELDTCNSSYRKVRNFIYFASLFVKKTTKGTHYDVKSKFIHIDFTFGMPKNYPVERNFMLRADDDYKEKNYIDNIKIITFNLDKIKKFFYNKDEKQIQKFKHLIMLDCNKEELEELGKLTKGDGLVEEYTNKVNKLNENETFRSFMTKEEDDKFILNTEKKLAFEEGAQEEKIEIAKNLIQLKTTDEIILQATGLSVEELNQLKKQINVDN